MNKLDLVIPVFNQLPLLRHCVESVKAHSGLRLGKIIFVDDASTQPGIAEFGREAGQYYRQRQNQGFAATVNYGVKRTSGEFFVLLNSDTEATPGWLEALASCLEEDEKRAVAGPLLLFHPASTDPTRPAGRVQSCGFAIGISGLPYHRLIGWTAGHARVQESRDDLQGITAACWAVRREAWTQLGGLDEQYRSYFEDADFCLRARHAGYKIAYCPQSVLYHEVGASMVGGKVQTDLAGRAQLFLSKQQGKIRYDEWNVL